MISRIAYNLRGRWLAFRIRNAGGRCGANLKVESGFNLGFPLHPGLSFGDNVYFGPNCLIDSPAGAVLRIGNDVSFTMGVVIGCHHVLSIGNDVLVGEYTSIRDSSHGMATRPLRPDGAALPDDEPGPELTGFLDDIAPIRLQPMVRGTIKISNDVWIGRGCAILGGTTLGTGCVVGANSLTRAGYSDYKIIAGAPAKEIGDRRSKAAQGAGISINLSPQKTGRRP